MAPLPHVPLSSVSCGILGLSSFQGPGWASGNAAKKSRGCQSLGSGTDRRQEQWFLWKVSVMGSRLWMGMLPVWLEQRRASWWERRASWWENKMALGSGGSTKCTVWSLSPAMSHQVSRGAWSESCLSFPMIYTNWSTRKNWFLGKEVKSLLLALNEADISQLTRPQDVQNKAGEQGQKKMDFCQFALVHRKQLILKEKKMH